MIDSKQLSYTAYMAFHMIYIYSAFIKIMSQYYLHGLKLFISIWLILFDLTLGKIDIFIYSEDIEIF